MALHELHLFMLIIASNGIKSSRSTVACSDPSSQNKIRYSFIRATVGKFEVPALHVNDNWLVEIWRSPDSAGLRLVLTEPLLPHYILDSFYQPAAVIVLLELLQGLIIKCWTELESMQHFVTKQHVSMLASMNHRQLCTCTTR